MKLPDNKYRIPQRHLTVAAEGLQELARRLGYDAAAPRMRASLSARESLIGTITVHPVIGFADLPIAMYLQSQEEVCRW